MLHFANTSVNLVLVQLLNGSQKQKTSFSEIPRRPFPQKNNFISFSCNRILQEKKRSFKVLRQVVAYERIESYSELIQNTTRM